MLVWAVVACVTLWLRDQVEGHPGLPPAFWIRSPVFDGLIVGWNVGGRCLDRPDRYRSLATGRQRVRPARPLPRLPLVRGRGDLRRTFAAKLMVSRPADGTDCSGTSNAHRPIQPARASVMDSIADDKGFYTNTPPAIFETTEAYDAGETDFYHRLAQDHPGRILELGCGTGQHLRHLAGKGHTVFGLELVTALAEAAQQAAATERRGSTSSPDS